MLRLFVLAVAIVCNTRHAYGRNETIHACELVIKCFQEADSELTKCQNILSTDPRAPEIVSDDGASNETIVEPTTAAAAPSDDCMDAVKQKMIQKRALVAQRAQAFALCLDERMDRGPEDVDPRKFRYCNTVISRYMARTTVNVPPEFTLLTTPVSAETPTTASSLSSSTASSNKRSQQLITFSSPGSASRTASTQSHVSSTVNPTIAQASRVPLRPRRQAQGDGQAVPLPAGPPGNVRNRTSDVIRPPSASPPGRRVESPNASAATTRASTTEQHTSAAAQSTSQTHQGSDGAAGRIGAVGRFSTGQASGKDGEQEPLEDKVALKNSTAAHSPVTAQPSLAAETSQAITLPQAVDANQTSSQQPEVLSSVASVAPINNITAESSDSSSNGSTTRASSAEIHNVTSQPQAPGNGTFSIGANAVLVQQQEQAANSVLQPLDQPIIEVPELSGVQSSSSAPAIPVAGTTSTSASVTLASTAASGVSASGMTAEEKQRNRVENLRESRRRVLEFKSCMARARIKKEECKPMVNCCPDSVKCHLRYELSDLHDQIHRLELEISEGRQRCLEKKKLDDVVVDALDQIDEEDLISDESIVSQQLF